MSVYHSSVPFVSDIIAFRCSTSDCMVEIDGGKENEGSTARSVTGPKSEKLAC